MMEVSNTIQEYLKWRGDLTFQADPFNEVDNLLFAQLAYVDFDGIVGASRGDKISIGDVCRKYWETRTEEEIRSRQSFTNYSPFLLKPVAESRRFEKTMLSGYVNFVSKDREAQMSAVQFNLEDGTTYVAFRGTDETIIGWKEDFNLSYMTGTGGQKLALKYMEDNFADTSLRLRVGGHSKGGNFAVYAATFASDAVKAQIMEIYTNDGPGFRNDVTQLEEYKKVLEKTVNIIPAYSIIGRLLSSGLQPRVVKSSGSGIMQHDAMTWQVMGNRFQNTKRDKDSIFLENVLDDWIRSVDDEARRLFVDQIFNVLQSSGGRTMKDVRSSSLSDIGEAINVIRKVPKEQQKEFSRVLARLLRSGEKNIYEQIGQSENLPEVIRKWAAERESELRMEGKEDESGRNDD